MYAGSGAVCVTSEEAAREKASVEIPSGGKKAQSGGHTGLYNTNGLILHNRI